MSERVYIPGHGPMGARLMILGEAPAYHETLEGKPFVGASGKELTRLCQDAGINRSDCWLTNVCKYEVPPNAPGGKIPFAIRAKTAGINIDEQLIELQQEITAIKPNCILALGGTALWALSGKNKISQFRGSIMHGMGVKFVPSYHPAHLLHTAMGASEIKGYWNRQIMIFDFKRAKYQSTFPERVLPHRTLQICRSSYDLQEFRNRYKGKIRLAVDIEADGTCIPVCIGLAFNKSHGMTVPLWNMGGISTIPSADMVQIWLILADMLVECDIVGQNFNYDRDKIKRLGFIIRRLVSDTMLKAHAINPELPKNLAFNTSIYTEEPFYKDEGMYEGSILDLLTGCARDACVTFEVDEAMDADLDELGQRPFFENFLMQLPGLYWDIERQGLRQNVKRRDELLHKYIEWDEKCRYELFKLTGTEINVNSPKQIGILLWDNLKLPRKNTTGEEDLTALLNSPNACRKPEQRRILELILEDRRVRRTIANNVMVLPDFDGRIRTTYFPCLETGRTSTGQQEPPIRPSIEVVGEDNKKKKKALGTPFQTMTKHGDIGADVREQYEPDEPDEESGPEGYIFVQADSSQAEARVIFRLANDEEALRDIDNRDYHAWTASWFFGGSEADYSKKILGYEHPTRFVGKTLRHAGHLGAGKRRAAITVNTDARKYKIPIAITEAIAEHALMVFHSRQPKIRQVFQAGVIDCLKVNRRLIAPLPYGVDAPFGGGRTFYERWGEELFRQGFSYMPQRAVSDNTKAAALRIRKRIPRIRIALESHDSLLFCIPVVRLLEWTPIIKEEMERPINFSRCSLPRPDLVIPCEIETGMNYKDLKKFKDIPIISAPIQLLSVPTEPKTPFEEFLAKEPLPPDSKLTDIIYHHQVERKFVVDD